MTVEAYRQGLRSAVRGLWSGAMDDSQFFDAMRSTMERRLTEAWESGAAECGVLPDELTSEEQVELANAIFEELGYVQSFADDIEANSREQGGKLGPLLDRAERWVNRYKDIENRAKSSACADQKLQWHLGMTENHCRDCLRYDKRVYRGSTWGKWDIRPQHRSLACHGVNCDCDLRPTDEPLTRGRPPRMTG